MNPWPQRRIATLEPLDLEAIVRDADGFRYVPGPHGDDCQAFVRKWTEWWDRSFGPGKPPAMVAITEPDEYRQLIGAKSRNMLNRAETIGIVCGPFDHDAHLEDLFRINRSMPVRSGGPMRPAYLQRPALIERQPRLCDLHRSVWIGATLNGELRAYAHLVVVHELGIVNTILGEGPYLRATGLMNKLVHYLVAHCGSLGFVRYLNYLTLDGPAGLVHFKTSVGFRATPIERLP